jgi:hypothetical protein
MDRADAKFKAVFLRFSVVSHVICVNEEIRLDPTTGVQRHSRLKLSLHDVWKNSAQIMSTSPHNFKPDVDNVKSEFTKQLQWSALMTKLQTTDMT